MSGVEGNGWSLAWHPGEGWAEKVLPKHGLLFIEIKDLVFPTYYKTYNLPVGVAQCFSVDP